VNDESVTVAASTLVAVVLFNPCEEPTISRRSRPELITTVQRTFEPTQVGI